MQYKNIQLVEGISPNQNANSYGRNELIGNPNIRSNVKL